MEAKFIQLKNQDNTKQYFPVTKVIKVFDGDKTQAEINAEKIDETKAKELIDIELLGGVFTEVISDGYDIEIPISYADRATNDGLGNNIHNEIIARVQQTDYDTKIGEIDRINTNLQKQIDALISRADVVDIVATKAELIAYDITSISENDVIKVLKDESQNNEKTYYRLVSNSWIYIGSEGDSYTKAEADAKHAELVNRLVDYATKTELTEESEIRSEADKGFNESIIALRNNKQDILIAGKNITIDNGVISSLGGTDLKLIEDF